MTSSDQKDDNHPPQFVELIPLRKAADLSGLTQGHISLLIRKELLGLKWKDINWDRKTIIVQRQLARIPGGKLEFVQPKTRSSVRTISLGEMTIATLKEHQKCIKRGKPNTLNGVSRTG